MTDVLALLPSLYVTLLLQLGALPLLPSAIPRNVYLQEMDMLNFALDRKILQSLPVWDQSVRGGLRDARGREVFDNTDTTPILIIHLWATWCSPCQGDFVIWRKLKAEIFNQNNGRVRVAHIALQSEVDDVPKFIHQLGDKMPTVPLYFDRGGRLAKNLSRAFADKGLPPLPITIWLDPERIIRRVIVGSIEGRIDEVKAASASMLRLVEQQEKSGRRPKPKDIDEYDAFSQ